MILSIIVAVSDNGVIGRDNQLIWRLPSDMRRFKALTIGHSVIMGRKTFESLGAPLSDRRNIVITRSSNFVAEGVEIVSSIEEALDMVVGEDEVFIIGGGTIYAEFLDLADRLYITEVHTRVDGDTFLPPIDNLKWEEIFRERHEAGVSDEYGYTFVEYVRKGLVVGRW